MKIGDMVRYTPQMTGLQNCFGIVIGLNGTAVEVRWTDSHSTPAALVFRTRNTEISTELPEFLEVISESR